MSQYATIKTKIRDGELLVRCLKELGYPVEVGKDLPLLGYTGDVRRETADIVIRRKHIGFLSNDIGFKKVGEYYEIIISDFDRGSAKGKKVLALEQKVVQLEREIRRKVAEEEVRRTLPLLKNKGFKLRKRRVEGKKVIYECVRLT